MISAIILGVALVISLVGLATVVIILLMKTKVRVQTGATTVTIDNISSKKAAPIEDYTSIQCNNDITTNENIAYIVHSPTTDMD